MSIFAGIFLRHPGQKMPVELLRNLRSAISRDRADALRLHEFKDNHVFMIKVDISAAGNPAEFVQPDSLAFVAGDPLLQENAAGLPLSRSESIGKIAEELATGEQDCLHSCRGTFCAAIYENTSHRLHLITDKFGVRPIYYWVSPDYIVFSTALRVLESVSFCKKTLNLQAVAETACFGYPLSNRTPYEDIFCLLAAEVVSIDCNAMARTNYWHWDQLAAAPSTTDFAGRLYLVFQDAIMVRLGKKKNVAAFLSGGLDSRAIVAVLRDAGANVFTANFGNTGSQDQVLGQLAAERLETHHSHLMQRPLVEGDPYSTATVREWLDSTVDLADNDDHGHVIWSGDGGSVGLGHVYLNEDIVAATRGGNLQDAVHKFLSYNQWGICSKLIKPRLAATLDVMLNQGILSELKKLHPADPGRIFHLFLMLNDQRRHMFNHFENIDLTRIEFEMPFFDAQFMTEVLRAPIQIFLRHAFYLEWLTRFPTGVLETPWQAYPNHVPCPLQVPQGLSYQWDKAPSVRSGHKASSLALDRARKLLRSPGFARQFLRFGYLELFMLLMHWKKNNLAYLLHVPCVIYRYWSVTLAPPDAL
jgi:asparagine synthase (glutamine-hydrolysing)